MQPTLSRVLFEFSGSPDDPEQLVVKPGDLVWVYTDVGGGWVQAARADTSVMGVLPASYAAPLTKEELAELDGGGAAEAGEAPAPAQQQQQQQQQQDPPAPAPAEAAAAEAEVEAAQEDPKLAKYRRMLKTGLPQGAVVNAMQRDGVDVAWALAKLGLGDASSGGSGSSAAAADDHPALTGLPGASDPQLSKYVKMLKTGLPEGAVRNAMMRDGVDAALLFGGSSAPPKGAAGGAAAAGLADQLKGAKLARAAPAPAAAAAGPTVTEQRPSLASALAGMDASKLRKTPPRAAAAASAASSPSTPPESSPTPNPLAEIQRRAMERQQRQSTTPPKAAPESSATVARKRDQEEAHVLPRPAPEHREKAEQPCAEFKLDLRAAAGAKMCVCGHPKSDHGAKAADVADAPVGAHAPAKQKQPSPCNAYHVDVSAPVFGTCVCGHPKAAHDVRVSAGGDGAAPAPAAASALPPKQKQPTPCGAYHVDVSAAVFGTCVCGHPKAAHGAAGSSHPEMASPIITTRRSADTPPSSSTTAPVVAAEPCDNFHVDVTAKAFGVCRCGHSREAHDEARKRKTAPPLASAHAPAPIPAAAPPPPTPPTPQEPTPPPAVAARPTLAGTTGRQSSYRNKARPRPPPPPPPSAALLAAHAQRVGGGVGVGVSTSTGAPPPRAPPAPPAHHQPQPAGPDATSFTQMYATSGGVGGAGAPPPRKPPAPPPAAATTTTTTTTTTFSTSFSSNPFE